MKIIITEEKREMFFKQEFNKLFNNLTPTRTGHGKSISYIKFGEIYDDEVKGLVYNPNINQLIIYPDYFMSLRMFVSSEEELGELITKLFVELTDKPVRYYDILDI